MIQTPEDWWGIVDNSWNDLLEIFSHVFVLHSPAYAIPGDVKSQTTGRDMLDEVFYLKENRDTKLARISMLCGGLQAARMLILYLGGVHFVIFVAKSGRCMNILAEIQDAFRPVLKEYCDSPEEVEELLNMIRRSHLDCDYQVNFAMVLGKRLGRPTPELAAEILNKLTGKT